jgi:dTDP-4-dehydrorhamnose 3,5-epimerase-like enzyme
MKLIPTNIPEVVIIEHQIFADERGCFFESYRRELFNQIIVSDKDKNDSLLKDADKFTNGIKGIEQAYFGN